MCKFVDFPLIISTFRCFGEECVCHVFLRIFQETANPEAKKFELKKNEEMLHYRSSVESCYFFFALILCL